MHMEDKSLPYNLRLRKDHKASGSGESPKSQKQEKDFQEKVGEVSEAQTVVEDKCEKCGCSFELGTALKSHRCKNKSEKESMENQSHEGLHEKIEEEEKNKMMRKRRRKGIPTRSPLF